MSILRFSPRQIKFLELYFGGALMKDAARAAGYRGASDQALCNTGRAILDKFSSSPEALFRRVSAREAKVAKLLADMSNNNRPARQLIALAILLKCFK